ncbi:hypothetical protein Tco_1337295 [Tanacetum coccineum]
MGLWYPKDSGFELTAFLDANHAGCVDTCKSTSGGIQFLGDKLVSWMSKKQDCTAMSSVKAEYVVLSASFEESLNLTFDESPPPTKLPPLVDDDVGEEEAIRNNIKVVNNIVKNKSKKID